MKKTAKHIENQVKEAFDELVSIAKCSRLLGKIAKNPEGGREVHVERIFRTTLRAKPKGKVKILPDQKKETYGCKHDIVGERNSRTVIVVEIKTPSTESRGIRSKIRRPNGLPKDIDSLGKALDNKVRTAYELVVLFECYAVNKKGKLIQISDTKIREKYGIKYPTESGYIHHEGEQKVHDAMKMLSKDNGLKVKRIKGWDRVELPSPSRNIRAFIDCALYRVRQK